MAKHQNIALIIGNANYTHSRRLQNSINDAALITRRFQRLGYEIVGGATSAACPTGLTGGTDLTFDATNALLGAFMSKVGPGSTVVVYYAGHGIQVGDQNYLVPIDFTPDNTQMDCGLIPIKRKLETLAARVQGAGTVVLFLDACRDGSLETAQKAKLMGLDMKLVELGAQAPTSGDPVEVSTRGGLSAFKMRRDPNIGQTFIGFATAPGDVAQDGVGGNSSFAAALDRQLSVRGLEIMELYDRVSKDVADDVAHEINDVQSPWKESNLSRPLHLHGRTGWPIIAMALGGGVAGAIICMMLFEKGRIVNPLPDKYWALGLLFGIVAAAGTMRWGSGLNARDAFFALAGPGIGFALALAVLQIVPSFPTEVSGTLKLSGSRELASKVYETITILGGVLYFVGTFLVRFERKPDWPKTGLGWFNWLMTWTLPLLIVGVLLRLQEYMTAANPLFTALAMFALLGGVIYATSVALSCRAQGGNFAGFGPFTGAITVGLLMAAFFAAFTAFGIRRDIAPDETNWLMVALGTAWHALLGGQLGYCFTYYVPNYRRRALDHGKAT